MVRAYINASLCLLTACLSPFSPSVQWELQGQMPKVPQRKPDSEFLEDLDATSLGEFSGK